MLITLPPMMSDRDAGVLVDLVTTRLSDDARMIEFGCGGSTTLLAEHLKPEQFLYSVEHNAEWFGKVHDALCGCPQVLMYFAPLAYPIDFWRFATPYEETGAGAANYIHPPDIPWGEIAFAFVDGIARGPVLASLRTKLKSGTPVILHDWFGRETWYSWATDLYETVQTFDQLIEMRVP